MKKKILIICMILMVESASAQSNVFCGEVKRFRVWSGGSDTYGIWVEYNSNPEQCSGGFYIPHSGENKDFVFSFLLAARAQKESVCIQIAEGSEIGSRCKINYAMNQ